MIDFKDLPKEMKNDKVLKYYNILKNKKFYFFLKRVLDIVFSVALCVLFLPILILVSIIIKIDSKGPVFFRQERLTIYRKTFKIFKFRTMIKNFHKSESCIAIYNDLRITRVGKILRKFRIDEIPQLFNIILGDMSFVGTRPEILKYVLFYSDEMNATFLTPAGLTSLASIRFKDEFFMLKNNENADSVYLKEILPKKMKYNLNYLENLNFFEDLKILLKTLFEVFSL